MGVLNSSRAVIYSGAKSWKLASLSSMNSKVSFSSSGVTFENKNKSYSCSPILSSKTVTLLKSEILKVRCNSSDASDGKSSGFFGPEAAIDKTGKVNRWSMFVPAFMTHLCKLDVLYIHKFIYDFVEVDGRIVEIITLIFIRFVFKVLGLLMGGQRSQLLLQENLDLLVPLLPIGVLRIVLIQCQSW